MNPDLNTFLQIWTGSRDVSETESQRLLDLLQDDVDFRAECVAEIRLLGMCKVAQSSPPRWLDLAEVLGLGHSTPATGPDHFASGVMEQITKQIGGQQSRAFWSRLRWRPLPAAAAGMMIGILSASMVWAAYAVPLAARTIQRSITVLAEGFEASRSAPKRSFPVEANRWTGDISEAIGGIPGVVPVEGERMAQLNPPLKRKLSYAWRILDLEEFPEALSAESLRLEVAASFNTPGPPRPLRYQIRLAAFSQEPADVRAIWNDESVLFDTVLQHVGRNLLTNPSDTGWQTLSASLDIPPGTRSLVISLAAGETGGAQPSVYYLDDVQVRFVTRQTQP